MSRKRGKCPIGLCMVCGKDVAIKVDYRPFRHPDPDDVRQLCPGTEMFPSKVFDEEKHDFIDFIHPAQEPIKDEPVESTSSVMALGKEYPVVTEDGIVIGRARVEVGHIRILGNRWRRKIVA